MYHFRSLISHFCLPLYRIMCVSKIKTKPMYLVNKNSATQASSSSCFIWWCQSTIFSYDNHVNLESISFCPFCCQAKVKSVPSVVFNNDQRTSCLIQMENGIMVPVKFYCNKNAISIMVEIKVKHPLGTCTAYNMLQCYM